MAPIVVDILKLFCANMGSCEADIACAAYRGSQLPGNRDSPMSRLPTSSRLQSLYTRYGKDTMMEYWACEEGPLP
jgi:hypothetical protein